MDDRGTAQTSFEGDNHFKFKRGGIGTNTDHNSSLMDES
jgi:hypothetical protein